MRTRDKAWITLGAGVLAYELFCPTEELLSEAADEYLKRWPVGTRLAIAALALHLANTFDDVHLERFDIVHMTHVAGHRISHRLRRSSQKSPP